MQNVTAEMANKIAQNKGSDRKEHSETMALAGCYGQIGISAVAAAACGNRRSKAGSVGTLTPANLPAESRLGTGPAYRHTG